MTRGLSDAESRADGERTSRSFRVNRAGADSIRARDVTLVARCGQLKLSRVGSSSSTTNLHASNRAIKRERYGLFVHRVVNRTTRTTRRRRIPRRGAVRSFASPLLRRSVWRRGFRIRTPRDIPRPSVSSTPERTSTTKSHTPTLRDPNTVPRIPRPILFAERRRKSHPRARTPPRPRAPIPTRREPPLARHRPERTPRAVAAGSVAPADSAADSAGSAAAASAALAPRRLKNPHPREAWRRTAKSYSYTSSSP